VVVEKQRSSSDCNICTIAMALSVPYEEVMVACCSFGFNPHTRGTSNQIFSLFGLEKYFDYWTFYPGPSYINTSTMRYLLNGRRAIISTMSKNNRDGMHSVYWNGIEIFDPSNKLVYEKINEIDITDALFFNETSGKRPQLNIVCP
jgi:hypothetical protein